MNGDLGDWTVLETFNSVVEARVVESFLRAQEIEVELLDTNLNAYAPRGLGFAGMRLMVRKDQLDHARELLIESRKGTKLELVGEHTAIAKSSSEKWIWVLLLLLVMIVAAMKAYGGDIGRLSRVQQRQGSRDPVPSL